MTNEERNHETQRIFVNYADYLLTEGTRLDEILRYALELRQNIDRNKECLAPDYLNADCAFFGEVTKTLTEIREQTDSVLTQAFALMDGGDKE